MPEDLIGVKQETPDPSIAEADAVAEAQADEWLENRTAPEEPEAGGVDEAPEAEVKDDRPRDESGKFAKKEEATEEVEETTDQVDDAPEDTAEPVQDAVNPEELRKATAALQRDGVPPSVIDGMDPAAIVAWGSKRAATQAEVDRLGNELRDLKQSKDPAQSDAVASEPDADINWSELVEPFKLEFGDDAAAPLEAFGKTVLQHAQKSLGPVQEQLKQLQEMQAAVTADLINTKLVSARSRLSDRWEGLGDEGRWQNVVRNVSTLSQTGAYDDLDQMVEAACLLEFAQEKIAESESKLGAQRKKRANGTTTTTSRKTPPKDLSQDELEDALLNGIQDGDENAIRKFATRRGQTSSSELLSG